MRILVDTSVWIDLLNGYPSPEQAALAELIAGEGDLFTCGVVVAEVFQGLRRDRSRVELASLFRDLTFLEPSSIDLYLRAADLYRQLREKGITVRSTIDCLIAALAEEHGCFLLSRDRDLRLICDSGLINAQLWPAEPPAS